MTFPTVGLPGARSDSSEYLRESPPSFLSGWPSTKLSYRSAPFYPCRSPPRSMLATGEMWRRYWDPPFRSVMADWRREPARLRELSFTLFLAFFCCLNLLTLDVEFTRWTFSI